MIDLTPLDVRKKREDFRKALRGYEPQDVDVFLELVADRLEQLVLENMQLRERVDSLQSQVSSQTGREQAVQEALVTAQALRSEMREQAEREANILKGEAEVESRRVLADAETEARRLVAEAEAQVRTLLRDAERRLRQGQESLDELERRRERFLRAFRQLLERELDVVEVEEAREPLEDVTIDMDLGGSSFGAPSSYEPPPVREPAAGTASGSGEASGPTEGDAEDEAPPTDVAPGEDAGPALAASAEEPVPTAREGSPATGEPVPTAREQAPATDEPAAASAGAAGPASTDPGSPADERPTGAAGQVGEPDDGWIYDPETGRAIRREEAPGDAAGPHGAERSETSEPAEPGGAEAEPASPEDDRAARVAEAAAEARRLMESGMLDRSPEVRPPLDAPIDDLASAYDDDAGDGDPDQGIHGRRADPASETLSLSLDEPAPAEDDDRWG